MSITGWLRAPRRAEVAPGSTETLEGPQIATQRRTEAWVCATPTSTSYHDTEREAESQARLIEGGQKIAPVVYRIDLED